MMEMVRKKGLDLFKYSTFWKGVKFGRSVNDKQMHGNRVEKNRGRQECQELTSKMCWHNIESGPRALTLKLHIRPSPICGCVIRPNKRFWSLISLTFLWAHTRAYVNMWHENVAGSLETPSCFMDVLHSSHHYVRKDVATRSLPKNFLPCRMQQYMNKKRHGDIWTSVRTRQTQRNSPTEA